MSPRCSAAIWPALLLTLAGCRNDESSAPTTAPGTTSPPAAVTAPPQPLTPGAAGSGATAAPNAPTALDPSGGAGTASAAGTRAPLTDMQIAGVADTLNSGEIAQAQIAKTKAKNADVKSFAEMMIEHHGQARQQQPLTLSQRESESPLSQQLTQKSMRLVDTLNQASASDFDRSYMQAQVDAHQEALNVLQRELLPNAKAPELRSYLQTLQPKIEQHLERARSISSKLASAAPASPAAAGRSPSP